jgi:hypothetical protein
MLVNNECIIKGAGFFVGEVEGTSHDTGQVFIEEPFDASKPNYKGFRTVEYKCENSGVVKPIMGGNFPITAKVQMEISASKRGQVILVRSIVPMVDAQGQPRGKG